MWTFKTAGRCCKKKQKTKMKNYFSRTCSVKPMQSDSRRQVHIRDWKKSPSNISSFKRKQCPSEFSVCRIAAAPLTEQSASCQRGRSTARDTVWHVSRAVTLNLSRREETEHIQRRLSPSQRLNTLSHFLNKSNWPVNTFRFRNPEERRRAR